MSDWGYRASQPTGGGVLSRIDARAEELAADPNFSGNAMLTAFNEACEAAPRPSELYDLLSRTRDRLARKDQGEIDPYEIPSMWLIQPFKGKKKVRKSRSG